MSSTLKIYGKLDNNVQNLKGFLEKAKRGEHLTLEVKSPGGTLGAMHEMTEYVENARKEKGCVFSIEVVDARSAALLLVLYFNEDERVINEKSKGMIHLPIGTSPESKIREATVNFISNKTKLSPVQVLYYEDKIMSGPELIKHGFAKEIITESV